MVSKPNPVTLLRCFQPSLVVTIAIATVGTIWVAIAIRRRGSRCAIPAISAAVVSTIVSSPIATIWVAIAIAGCISGSIWVAIAIASSVGSIWVAIAIARAIARSVVTSGIRVAIPVPAVAAVAGIAK